MQTTFMVIAQPSVKSLGIFHSIFGNDGYIIYICSMKQSRYIVYKAEKGGVMRHILCNNYDEIARLCEVSRNTVYANFKKHEACAHGRVLAVKLPRE